MMLWGGAGVARAQLEIVPDAAPQRLFEGAARPVKVIWRNPGANSVESEVRTRVYQATSATVVLLADKPWKSLQVLPGQMVLESTLVDFPAVKAETTFLVQWLEGTNRMLGCKEVLVYATNLLAELKPLAGDRPVGIYDPPGQIKPTLRNLRVEFEDLENSSLADFSGKLAVIGPFALRSQMPEGLANRIRALAKRGCAVVWIQPSPGERDKLQPSFHVLTESRGAVVVVQAGLMADLLENPQSQMNLVYFCRLARGRACPMHTRNN